MDRQRHAAPVEADDHMHTFGRAVIVRQEIGGDADQPGPAVGDADAPKLRIGLHHSAVDGGVVGRIAPDLTAGRKRCPPAIDEAVVGVASQRAATPRPAKELLAFNSECQGPMLT
jgi:hypothetical protein